MYGGSEILPHPSHQDYYHDGYRNSEFLSLQCCELAFRDPIRPEELNTYR